MRAILFISSFPMLSETFLVSKFLGLLGMGWDVHIVCYESNPAQWLNYPALNKLGIRKRVHRTWPHRPRWLALALLPAALVACLFANPDGTLRYLRLAIRRWGWIKGLRRFYLDAAFIVLRPDLIHFEFGALAIEQADIGELLGCKVTVSFRGYDLNFSGQGDTGYYSSVWCHADALHLLGQDLWQRAVRRGCPPNKAHELIPPAIDIEKFLPEERGSFEPLGTVERPLRILSVGRLEWKKGYDFALQAVRLLQDAGVECEYRVIGSGAYLEPLAFTRHQLGLENCVEFLGGLSHPQVIEQMNWADVLLHAAVSEGFCNAVLEAQAIQLPVVCTDAGGLRENVEDGETGFIVPRRDPQALAEKLSRLAQDPRLRQRMGQSGRERVTSQFALVDQINRFDQFYRRVLNHAN